MEKPIANTYETVERGNAPVVKALIMYEDMITGVRAQASLHHLFEQFESDERLRTELWRFDLLSEPRLREMAADRVHFSGPVHELVLGQG